MEVWDLDGGLTPEDGVGPGMEVWAPGGGVGNRLALCVMEWKSGSQMEFWDPNAGLDSGFEVWARGWPSGP